jgi:hypothetical protein
MDSALSIPIGRTQDPAGPMDRLDVACSYLSLTKMLPTISYCGKCYK